MTESPATAAPWLLRAATVVLLAALVLVLWRLGPVLVTAFGGVVFAVAVRQSGSFLAQHGRLNETWWVAIILVLLLLAVVLGLWRFGTQLAGQFQQLTDTVSTSYGNVAAWLRRNGLEVGSPSLDSSQLRWLTAAIRMLYVDDVLGEELEDSRMPK